MNACRHTLAAALIVIVAMLAPVQAADMLAQQFPDVVDVKVHAMGGDSFNFDVTVSSPYDSPQRYADAFRIMSDDGVTFGVRTLFHDHASEQPFTRDLYGIHIPAGIQTVTVQARDKKHGYGGKTMRIALPRR